MKPWVGSPFCSRRLTSKLTLAVRLRDYVQRCFSDGGELTMTSLGDSPMKG